MKRKENSVSDSISLKKIWSRPLFSEGVTITNQSLTYKKKTIKLKNFNKY